MIKIGVGKLIGRIGPGTGQTLSGAFTQTVEADLLPAPCAVEEEVGCDAMKPALESPRLKPVQRAEDAHKYILGEVLGIMRIAGQPIGQPVNPSTVVPYQLFPSRRDPRLLRVRLRAR